jgi:uncharacterized protein YutE (UPF0331/DUF86 family)/predicted nucleotidyltransferase
MSKKILRHRKIKRLIEYLQKQGDVSLAFLFGSQARGMVTEESDFDIALYLREGSRRDFKKTIWLEIVKILEKEVDLVFLNDAPATLISSLFKTGIPLIIKNRELYWRLYLKNSLEAEDFFCFIKDYWKIQQRARSLSPEDKTRLLERLQFLEDELNEIKEFKKLTVTEYIEDKTKRRNIERWSENILNATIDIAKIILSSEKKKMPKTYQEALYIFAVHIGLDKKDATAFSVFANLRNILAHEYLDILYGQIQDFIAESQRFYQRLFKFLKRYL